MGDTDTITRTVFLVMPDGSEYDCDVTAQAEDKVSSVRKSKKYGWERAFLYLLKRASVPCYAHVRNATEVRFQKNEDAQ